MSDLCPFYEEYAEYFTQIIVPEMRKFMRHLAECPECQKLVLETKDAMCLTGLQTSDKKFIEKARAF